MPLLSFGFSAKGFPAYAEKWIQEEKQAALAYIRKHLFPDLEKRYTAFEDPRKAFRAKTILFRVTVVYEKKGESIGVLSFTHELLSRGRQLFREEKLLYVSTESKAAGKPLPPPKEKKSRRKARLFPKNRQKEKQKAG